MIGNQLHQFAQDEPPVDQPHGDPSDVGTKWSTKLICSWRRRPCFFCYYQDRFSSSVHPCSSYLDAVLFHPSAASLFPGWPHSPLPSCGRMISPSLNADLFYNKTRCIQGPASDVAGVIVLLKSGTDSDLCTQWRKWWQERQGQGMGVD